MSPLFLKKDVFPFGLFPVKSKPDKTIVLDHNIFNDIKGKKKSGIIQNTIAHELGHTIGLDYTNGSRILILGTPKVDANSVMNSINVYTREDGSLDFSTLPSNKLTTNHKKAVATL